jgi:dTDP-4-dehydrorhamnose reductase
MKPLLVIGRSGQLAKALAVQRGDAIFIGRDEADLSKPHQLTEILERHDPRAVINAAAYTQVDTAEKEEALATVVNAEAPAAMAIFCTGRGIPFVHFSTDYVFNGSGESPWHEDDVPAPLNAYGRSKLEGENAVEQVGGKYLIFRTSWVYDSPGKNFLNTILKLAAEREELRIINDQHGAPTYAPHLAQGAVAALENAAHRTDFPSGIYHLCSGGVTTWHSFAAAIVEHAKKRHMPVKVKAIYPIPAVDYPLPAARPYNSRLDCTKALSMFGVALPDWQEGLAECMELKQ